MRVLIAYSLATGRPLSHLVGKGSIPVKTGRAVKEFDHMPDLDRLHIDAETGEDSYHDRVDVPPFADGPAPLTLDMAALPAGTLVRAVNNAGAAVETSDPADPVRLTAPGGYAVQIRPPFPWRDLDQTVEVTDA